MGEEPAEQPLSCRLQPRTKRRRNVDHLLGADNCPVSGERAGRAPRVKINGSWFDGLTANEKKEDYWAEADNWEPAHTFPRKGAAAAETSVPQSI